MGYLGRDKDGLTGHVIGPDFDEATEAIYLACFALMTAIEALRQLVDMTDYDEQFQTLLDGFNAMAPYQQESFELAD